MTEIQLGTIRVGNDIMVPGEYRRKDGVISLGDSGPLWDHNLRWIYHDGKLVSDRSVIFGVNYDELEIDGLCYGKTVVIDDCHSQCGLWMETWVRPRQARSTSFWMSMGLKCGKPLRQTPIGA